MDNRVFTPTSYAEVYLQKDKAQKVNRLAAAHSPYLLQHAGNPVDWYPWSPEAFKKAAEEDKPVFLSIGYSTCHWCHVMEAESFSDPEVASLMNDGFVCVKVDREERPDVDQLYMTVCQLLTGSGGWPLTIVMTPDKKPFFAGTYFPRGESPGRPGMLQLIPRIKDLWTNQRDNVDASAAQIAEGLQVFMTPDPAQPPGPGLGERAFTSLTSLFDSEHGGFGSAPKFPAFPNLLFLQGHWSRTGVEGALTMIRQTLRAMRLGGIYDHLGFGFHRYSTDERWFAPHFEKMLYDQALAVLTYTEAFCATKDERLGEVAREVITYVLRDLQSPEGGFFSAEDADSEGDEGKFYTWSDEELDMFLDREEVSLFKSLYNTTASGNFLTESGKPTGRNILYLNADIDDLSRELEVDRQELDDKLKRIRSKLIEARNQRIRPMRDKKVMTDWNGLMIAALARASAVFEEPSYAEAAQSALRDILKSRTGSIGQLVHIRYSEDKTVPAFLDDYACLIWGMLELYQSTHRTDLLLEALRLADEMVKLFGDEDHGGFFLTSGADDPLPLRQKPSFDNPTPSGNAVAAMTLLRLGRLTGRQDLEEEAQKTFSAFAAEMGSNPAGFTFMVNALEMAQRGTIEIVVAGDPEKDDTKRFISVLRTACLPTVTWAVINPGDPDPHLMNLIPHARDVKTVDGKAAAYICRDFVCLAPTVDPEEMCQILSDVKTRD